jgi:hypothetical protein
MTIYIMISVVVAIAVAITSIVWYLDMKYLDQLDDIGDED